MSTTSRDQRVFFKIGNGCQDHDRYITIDNSSKIPFCGTKDDELSSKLIAAFGNEATWFLLGLEAIVLAILAFITVLIVVCVKTSRKSRRKREESVINPMYGKFDGQDYGYYAETRMEERNADYDAYYKDDYNTNITDYNEIYGKEKPETY